MKQLFTPRALPYFVSLIFTVLIGIAIFNFFYESRHSNSEIIARDIQLLAETFTRINETCGILSFDYQKNPVNFLNVEKFAGSEVGPMNLAHPEGWEGPYFHDNPQMQGREYLIVLTDKGYYLTPGEGVTLPNGQVVGQDISLEKSADLEAFIQDSKNKEELGQLFFAQIKTL